MKKIILMLLVLLVIPSGVAMAQAEKEMTIDEAYKAIPKERTPYNKKETQISEAEAKYLDHLFFVTDVAMQKRMMMLRHFSEGRHRFYLKTYNIELGTLLGGFDLIDAPSPSLQKAEDLIVLAIRQQQQFFNEWAALEGTPEYESTKQGYVKHMLVQISHQNLLAAYNVLMKLYPNETDHNKKSFYTHLCALDFI